MPTPASRPKRTTRGRPPSINWTPASDALISHMRSTGAQYAQILAALHKHDATASGAMSVRKVKERWLNTLRFEAEGTASVEISAAEEQQLSKAVREVEQDRWAGIVALYNVKAANKLSKGVAKKFYTIMQNEGRA